MHENDKRPNSGLWILVGRERTLEIMQNTNCLCFIFWIGDGFMVIRHIICYVGNVVHRNVYTKKKRCREDIIFWHSLVCKGLK